MQAINFMRYKESAGQLGPYLLLALIMPGGFFIMPFLWLFQRGIHGKTRD